ncbi:hypothetical protein Dsin_008884 [Dipteronia sinensis]|uniref:RNase H type-1 domain-containing protein n=1 Tax=Dipteronia sinensis TaxID=43782 RepID=A0AAE0EBD0_9ROSI|nr:hypothetical protein Dsin_008884 [Dipteronia sinensis]
MVKLARKKVVVESHCPTCNKAAETTIHALWDCNNFKHFRHNWLPRNVDGAKQNFSEAVWWSKNLLAKIENLHVNKGITLVPPEHDLGSWKPPKLVLYKINYDAVSSAGSRKVGIGAVICDSTGLVLASCSQVIEARFTTQVAKTLAVLRGIVFSRAAVRNHVSWNLMR